MLGVGSHIAIGSVKVFSCVLQKVFVAVVVNIVTRSAFSSSSIAQTCASLTSATSLARENEAGGSWGQEDHILHVNI